jgi:hypothetical protein
VVAALVEAIADGEAEFESYPSTELH